MIFMKINPLHLSINNTKLTLEFSKVNFFNLWAINF